MHTAMEARRPGAAALTEADHPEHEAHIAELRLLSDEFQSAWDVATRPALWNALQRRLARFIGESLENREVEESHNNAVLQSAHSDVELIDLHHRLVASLPPAELAMNMRWMLIGLEHQQRRALGRRRHARRDIFCFSRRTPQQQLHRAELRGKRKQRIFVIVGKTQLLGALDVNDSEMRCPPRMGTASWLCASARPGSGIPVSNAVSNLLCIAVSRIARLYA